MKLLHGTTAPTGNGTVMEVHLDILTANQSFLDWLESLGFENDPFKDFHPSEYTRHMTGRTRALPRDLHLILPGINALVESIIDKAQAQEFDLYAEIELVRETIHFPRNEAGKINPVLDGMTFRSSGRHGGAKADIHFEFLAGTVPEAVRDYLVSKNFYWVSTPVTQHGLAEEIATLQTTQYRDAKRIFDLLATSPLPFCTGIHLEQKLLMEATKNGLPMPEVIEVNIR